jgi:diaminohydroxyphosphoribosylaminopyrimidine deaminase/5-amino-6-(5-phosphoribosylamino)uracil reductase
MSDFTLADHEYMTLALKLAKKGKFSSHPNPQVGCVIVCNNKIIGEGWHQNSGAPHAEINALMSATQSVVGATAYVTLEPCAHQGKTGPCCEALIKAVVKRVVVACEDPFEKTAGKGIAAMRSAGIEVSVGLFEFEARTLNRGFFSRIERQKPFVCLKVAASIDGATAMNNGESQWITGEAARADVQKLRASSGAIMTGIGTVKSDNPALTVRDHNLVQQQPLRVLLDSQLQVSPQAKIFQENGYARVFCINSERRAMLEGPNVSIVQTKDDNNHVALHEVLYDLAQEGINDLLVEAGPVLSGKMLSLGLIDELVIYQAPHIMGSEVNPMFQTSAWKSLADRQQLAIEDIRKIGQDFKITARPVDQ